MMAVIFISQPSLSYTKAFQPCKMEDMVYKPRKVKTRTRMLWVALDSGDTLKETWVLWIC